MALEKAIGRHTVAEVRGDEKIVEVISWITGLPTNAVTQKLAAAHGATQVRNALREVWPWKSTSLGKCTVAIARDYDLREEIGWVTRATRQLVSRRINATNGKRLLRNLFWDYWPDAEREPPTPAEVDVGFVPETLVRDTEPAPPNAVPSLSADSRLSGRYTLRDVIGKGGFGTTWIAHDQLSDLDVVLKIPHAEDGGAIRNELRRAFRIVHPNICQAFPDRDDDTGQPFLVMQHGGEDIAHRLAATGQPFPLSTAVHILVSIADALDYLHDQLVLHLDVTPTNILIDEEDVVRLTDFGASASARAHVTPEGQHTRLATEVHSFNRCYAAPELYEGQARSRSDQYSLFLVFYSLLDGKLQQKPHFDFRPLAVLTSDQNEILRRALSRDPSDRFETCSEPARALADDMGNVPEQVLGADLERLFAEFVNRVDREQRKVSAGTERLGGAVKLGRGFERILQGMLRWMSTVDGFDPLEALREFDKNATSLDRSVSSALARAIVKHAPGEAARRPEIASIVADLAAKKDGRSWHLINARNDVVHGRRAPDAILPWATSFAELLRNRPPAQ